MVRAYRSCKKSELYSKYEMMHNFPNAKILFLTHKNCSCPKSLSLNISFINNFKAWSLYFFFQIFHYGLTTLSHLPFPNFVVRGLVKMHHTEMRNCLLIYPLKYQIRGQCLIEGLFFSYENEAQHFTNTNYLLLLGLHKQKQLNFFFVDTTT